MNIYRIDTILRFRRYKGTYQLIFLIVIVLLLTIIAFDAHYPDGGLVRGHDTPFHLKRFKALGDALNNGSFPFYIDSETLGGYGYGTNLFYPDFMLIPFALFIKYIGLVDAYKLMLFFSFLLCALLSYISIDRVFKNYKISILFSLLYTFCLYRISDFAIRNALGEYLALSFIPIVFWGLYEILFGDYKKKWYIIGIGFTCIALSHLLSVLIIFIIVVLFLVIYYKKIYEKPQRLLYLVFSGILTILLTLFFLLPMYEQMHSNLFYYEVYPLVAKLTDRALSFQLVIQGMFAGMTVIDQDSSNVGLTVFIPLLCRFFIKDNKKSIIHFADISAIVGFILLIAGTAFFPWEYFPFNKLTIIQFPWRFVIGASFLFSLSSSIYLSYLLLKDCRFFKFSLVLIACLLFLIKTDGWIFQGKYHDYVVTYRGASPDMQTYEIIGAEYIPAQVPSIDHIIKRGNTTIELDKDAEINDFGREKGIMKFNINTDIENKAILPLLYYKGYKATLNGEEIPLQQSDKGLVEITVPRSGNIRVWYEGTILQRISLFISLSSLLVFIVYLIYKKRNINTLNNKNNV